MSNARRTIGIGAPWGGRAEMWRLAPLAATAGDLAAAIVAEVSGVPVAHRSRSA